MSGVAGIVLAAGAGTRFGGDLPKQLARFRGRPLVSWPLAALAAGGVERRILVLGCEGDRIASALEREPGLTIVLCADWREGLSASLRAGLAAATDAPAAVVVLGDQPLLRGAAVARVLADRDPTAFAAIRATYAGTPAHPTLIEAPLFAAASDLRGDAGARDLLRDPAVRVHLVACDGLGRPDDIDTPADLSDLAVSRPVSDR